MAPELTAARQAMMKTSYKLDVVLCQAGNIRKQVTGMRDQLRRMEIMLQKIVYSQRNTTEPALGRSTPEGNFKYPSTGFSVVATGWENPDEVCVKNDARFEDGTVVSKSEGVEFTIKEDLDCAVLEDFGIPSWLFELSLPTPDPIQEPNLVKQWPQSPKEYLSQPHSKYQHRQWNPNFSNERVHNFYKSLEPLEWNQQNETNIAVVNNPDEAKFDLAQLYVVGRADKRLRCTGLFWKLPPWPDFCTMNYDRIAQHSDYKVLLNSHSVKQYNHIPSVLDYTDKFKELVKIWPFVNEAASDTLEDTIKHAIDYSITWPVRKVIPIISGDYNELELKSVGTLVVNLMQARELTNKDADIQSVTVKIYDNDGIQEYELLVSGGTQQVIRVWDPGRSKNMRWHSSPLGVGGGLTFGVVSAAGRARTLPNGHHCFSMRLTLEYSTFSSLDSDEPFARKFNNPKHSHYVILSKIVHMGDKANGAVEFCGVRLGQVRNLLGMITYDPKSCVWMSVVNVINLDKRRKHNITENYLLLLKKFKTKDGVTVAKSIDFQDRVKNVGASLVKQVANATNDTAGDGTTCATVLTKAIFTEGCKSAAAVMNAMGLRRGISMAVDAIVINLKSMARTISTSEGIAQVGSISANGKVVQRLTRISREKVSAGPLKLKETDCNDCIVQLANKCIHQEVLFDSAATAVNVLSVKAATRSNYIKFAKITPATCSTLSMKQGRGIVEEISTKLRDTPSYFNESDYKYYLTVENLEKASMTNNHDGREILAGDAFSLLTRIPDSADLSAIGKRFENRRFYEAVIQFTLQKAHTLDSIADVINGQIDVRPHDTTIAQCEQYYKIVMNALSTLKGVGQSGTQRADQSSGSASALDPTSRSKYSNQLIPLSVQWPDTALHEHIYRTLIEFGLENELLEYGGFDLVAFLRSAGRKLQEEVREVSVVALKGSKLHDLGAPISTIQTKYIELLARYYVLKGEYIAAARSLLIGAEGQCSNAKETPTLKQRYQSLSSAVFQAKSTGIAADSSRNHIDSSIPVYLLEGKLAVFRLQMQIKPELEYLASRLEHIPGSSEFLSDPFPRDNIVADAETAMAAKDKAIKQVFPNTQRCFSYWHILKNAQLHLGTVYTFQAYQNMFMKCLQGSDSEMELKESWAAMLHDYKLQDNNWLNDLYRFHHRWCSVFNKDTLEEKVIKVLLKNEFEEDFRCIQTAPVRATKSSTILSRLHTPLQKLLGGCTNYLRQNFWGVVKPLHAWKFL